MHIDKARRDDQAAGVDHLMSARRDAWLDPADPAIDDLDIGRARRSAGAINEHAASDQDLLRHRVRLPVFAGTCYAVRSRRRIGLRDAVPSGKIIGRG
jgi:hypothetical protein